MNVGPLKYSVGRQLDDHQVQQLHVRDDLKEDRKEGRQLDDHQVQQLHVRDDLKEDRKDMCHVQNLDCIINWQLGMLLIQPLALTTNRPFSMVS